MRIVLGFVGLLCLMQGIPATADEVTLINGDRLTGHIVELNAESLRMHTELFGEVSIPRSAIASLSSDQELAVTLPDERVVVGTLAPREGQVDVRTKTEEVTVATKDLKSLRTAEGQAVYEESLKPGWLDNWQLGIDVALSGRGGGGTTSMSIGLDGVRRTRNDEFTVYHHSFSEKEKKGTVVNDDKLRAGALYARDLTERTYYFGSTDFDYDALQNLNLRSVLGGGLGWRVKETQRVNFDLFGGGAFNQEFFQDEAVRRSAEGLGGEELQWQLTPRAYFQERLILYPNLSNPGEYRAQLSFKLELKINTWLSWQLAYSNHFLSDPPPETKKNDNLLTSGLRLTFGRGGIGGKGWRRSP